MTFSRNTGRPVPFLFFVLTAWTKFVVTILSSLVEKVLSPTIFFPSAYTSKLSEAAVGVSTKSS